MSEAWNVVMCTCREKAKAAGRTEEGALRLGRTIEESKAGNKVLGGLGVSDLCDSTLQ